MSDCSFLSASVLARFLTHPCHPFGLLPFKFLGLLPDALLSINFCPNIAVCVDNFSDCFMSKLIDYLIRTLLLQPSYFPLCLLHLLVSSLTAKVHLSCLGECRHIPLSGAFLSNIWPFCQWQSTLLPCGVIANLGNFFIWNKHSP